MGLLNNSVLNIFSVFLLIVIYTHSSKQDREGALPSKLYLMMLQVTILLLVLDIFSRFDGRPDTVYPFINHIGNFLVFLLNPVLPSIWLLYVHEQVYPGKGKTKRLLYPLLAVNIANAALLIVSQFFGWFYYIDSDNIYHRGPFFFFLALLTFTLIIVSFVLLISNRKKIEKRHYFALVFFAVPPTVGIIFQIAFYGMSLMLNCTVLSLLIVFLDVQNQSIYTDYLTGVYNRKKLEIFMNEKISASSEHKTFSAIMIDLDNFKAINDTFGHETGDNALQISAKLFNSCLRSNDFIARFGGDEFCIVLDTSDENELEQIVCRINQSVKKYNESSGQPYELSFSMGYAVYGYSSGMKMEAFQKQIDLLMYENKQTNKKKFLY